MTDQPDGQNDDERLIDVIDIASAAEAQNRNRALLSIQAKCKQQQSPRKDGTFAVTDCEECGNEIGEGRLRVAAMNLLCVFCASAKERQR